MPDLQMGFSWKNRYQYLEPMHDRKAMDAVVNLIREIKPHYVILLGDMLDLAPWSTRFPRKPEYKQTTQPVIDEMHWWLADIRSVAPGAKIVYMAGNHEERMHKAMVEKLPEATYLAKAFQDAPALSIRNLLRLDDLHIEYVGPYGEDWWLWDRVRITHGTKVRSGGGATAVAIAKTARWSEVYGHVHKVEMMQKTFHGPFGRNVITAMSPGCLCRVDGTVPGVNLNPDWQQGCGVATLNKSTCRCFLFTRARLFGTDELLRGKTPLNRSLLKLAGNSLLEISMAKKGKFNIFALATRILRVGREITNALSDDKKISPDERDAIIALLLEEVSEYLDEIMG